MQTRLKPGLQPKSQGILPNSERMHLMRRVIGIAIAAAFLLAVGVYHGLATDRWSGPDADDHPVKWLASPPLEVGEWKGEVLPRAAEDDPKTGVVNCRFTHARSGRWVLTAVTSGRAGRVAIHNP